MEVDGIETTNNDDQKKVNRKRKLNNSLDAFAGLIANKPKLRIKSSAYVVNDVIKSQQTEQGEKDLKYALTRLIRGAGSTQSSSRQGYFTALCTLLKSVECNVDDIIEIIEKELHFSSNNSKSEQADIAVGQILVCGAVLRSDTFSKTTLDNQKKIIEILVKAGKKRTYLMLMAYTFLVDSLESLTEETFVQSVFPVLETEVNDETFGLDNLYFLLSASEKFPKIMRKVPKFRDFFSEANYSKIVDIFVNVLPLKQILEHPAYELTCRKIAGGENVGKFISLLDEVLTEPTPMKRMIVTICLMYLVENLVNTKDIALVLPDRFMRQILQHFKHVQNKKQDELQLFVYELFKALVKALKKENVTNATKIAVVKRMLFSPGVFYFEKETRSKVVQQITATLDEEGVKELNKVYESVLLGNYTKSERVYASQLMAKLLSHPSVKSCIDWKVDNLVHFMKMGLLKDENITGELATNIKTTFFNSLDIKFSKLDELQSVLSKFITILNESLTDRDILRTPLTDEEFELWEKTNETIKEIESKINKSHRYPVFLTLFLQMGLHLFNDPKVASETLKELFLCLEKVKEEKKKRRKSAGMNESAVQQDEVQWIEVVVDLFLNLLSQNSHLLRNLINSVFPHLCKDLNANALHQILSVLDPSSGVNPLSKSDSDDDDEDDDSDEEDKSENDDSDQDDSDEESDENEDEDVSDDDQDEQETVNDKLKMAVQQALGNNGYATDEESVDMDQMDEEECEKLNAALGEAFKQFKPNVGKKSKKQSKDSETLTHFRVRVLDLIDCYLGSSNLSMILCLEIMLPLLQTLEFSIRDEHQRPLKARLDATLKKLADIKKFESVDEIDEDILPNLLKSILDKGSKHLTIVHEMGDEIQKCCLFIIRCVQYFTTLEEVPKKTRKHTSKKINEILVENLNTLMTGRDSPSAHLLFKNLFNMVYDGNTILAKALIPHIFDKDIRWFRRIKALQFLKIFLLNNRLVCQESLKNELVEIATEFQSNLIQAMETKDDSKDKFFSTVSEVINVFKRISPTSDVCDWSKLATDVTTYKKNKK